MRRTEGWKDDENCNGRKRTEALEKVEMNKLKESIYRLVDAVQKENGWDLSRPLIEKLGEAVSPFVRDSDDLIAIRRKIVNYYEYCADVKGLRQDDSPTVEKYQQFIKKIIGKRFQNLPRIYDLGDLVSECWIVIFRKGLNQYKYASRLTTYLYPIIIHKVLCIIRKEKKSVEERFGTDSISDPTDDDNPSDGPTREDVIEGEDPGPEKLFEFKEISEIIDGLLEKEVLHYMKKTKLAQKELEQLVLQIFVLGELKEKYPSQLNDTMNNLYLRRNRLKGVLRQKLKDLIEEIQGS